MGEENKVSQEDIKYLESLGIKKSTAVFISEKFIEPLDILRKAPMKLIPYMSSDEILKAQALDAKSTYACNLFSLLEPYGFRLNAVMNAFKNLAKELLLDKPEDEELDLLDVRILEKSIMRKIKEAPYLLCEYVPFKTVDVFALNQGVENTSELRIEAAILEVLKNCNKASDSRLIEVNGDSCILQEKLYELVKLLLDMDVDRTLFHRVLHRMFMEDESIHISHIGGQTTVFSRHAADIEFGIAKIIDRKFKKGTVLFDNISRLIEKAEAELGILLSDEQSDAVRMALTSPVSIITGGPGTGKTAVQKVLIETFEWVTKCKPVRLIAPTGQAAKRMTESTGYPATTIHKALQISAGAYDVPDDLVLDEGLIIADEASMIDEELFHALISSISDDSKVVIVGDVNQLPAIGFGAVLRELINSKTIPVTMLTKVFRQADDSPIAYNAARIKSGEQILIENDGFQFKTPGPDTDLVDLVCKTYEESVLKAGIDNVICLTAFRKYTDTGVDELNLKLRDLVRTDITKKTPFVYIKNKKFYEGDKIVYNKNKAPLVNGDLGVISKIKGHKTAECIFGDTEVTLQGADLESLDLAYAQTVHKSQGAGFKTVVMIADERHQKMLSKELVYTAVTRAKETLICCADKKTTFLEACKNPAKARFSLLGKIVDSLVAKV